MRSPAIRRSMPRWRRFAIGRRTGFADKTLPGDEPLTILGPLLHGDTMGEPVKRIFRNLDDRVDLIMFLNSVDPHIDLAFLYATRVTDGLFEGCAAWLTPDGKAAITTSALEEEAAKKSGLPLDVFRTRDESSKLIKKRLAGHRKIGINASELTYAAFQRLRKLAPRAARFVDVSGAVMKARLVKDAQEVDLIQRACDIASRAFEETLSFIQTGVTEAEVA